MGIAVIVAALLLCKRRKARRRQGIPVSDGTPRPYTVKGTAGGEEAERPSAPSSHSRTTILKQAGHVPISSTTASQTHLLGEDLYGEISPLFTGRDSTGATLGQEPVPSPLSLFFPLPPSGYQTSRAHSHGKILTAISSDQPSTSRGLRFRRDIDSMVDVEASQDDHRQENKELRREIALLRALGRYPPDRERESYPYTPSSPPAYPGESLV